MYILILIDVFITYIVSIDRICEQEGGNDSDAGIATHLSHFCHSPVTVTSPIYRTRSIERRLAGVLLTVP